MMMNNTLVRLTAITLGGLAINLAGALGQSDDCAAPTPIMAYGTFPFDLTTATTGAAGQNQVGCDFFAGPGVERDVWFCWTAPDSGNVTLSTCGETSVDTKIVVYQGCSCPALDGSTPEISCNDDVNEACGFQSELTFSAVMGNQYLIQLGTSATQGGTAGPGNLVISNPSAGSASDECSAPNVISGEGQFAFDTTTATTGFDGQDFSNCSISGLINNDQWFCWTPPQDGFYTISTCGSTFDTRLAVYEDFICACPFGPPLVCNDDGCGEQSTVTIGAAIFRTYMIQVGNAVAGVGGTGTLEISRVQFQAGDECSVAGQIAGTGKFPFETTAATTGTASQDFNACGMAGPIHNDAWLQWTAPADGLYVLSTCDTAFDTRMAIYEQFDPSCPAGSPTGCSDDDCGAAGLQSSITILASRAASYYLQIGAAAAGVGGDASLLIARVDQCADPTPTNDLCASPLPYVEGFRGSGMPFTTMFAGTDGPPSSCSDVADDQIHHDVWFSYQAPFTAVTTVSTCGTADFDTKVAVYTSDCGLQPAITCGDELAGQCSPGTGAVSFEATAGQVYHVRVGGHRNAQGSGTLHIDQRLIEYRVVGVLATEAHAAFPPQMDGASSGTATLNAVGDQIILTVQVRRTGAGEAWNGVYQAGGNLIVQEPPEAEFLPDQLDQLLAPLTTIFSDGVSQPISVSNGYWPTFTNRTPLTEANTDGIFYGMVKILANQGNTSFQQSADGEWINLYSAVYTLRTACARSIDVLFRDRHPDGGPATQPLILVSGGISPEFGLYGIVDAASYSFLSTGTECPECPCERTGDSPASVDVFDLLGYLDAWFAEDPSAELTDDNPVDIDVFDLLAFLDCWFPASTAVPCP